MREREGEREGGTDGETACASTRDLPHSRLPPLCFISPLLLSSPILLVVFIYLLILPHSVYCCSIHPLPPSPLLPPFPLSLPPLTLSIPAVLPPFVPALHAEDDTSNFEEPEQAAPRPASAAQQGAPPVGFQGRDLPFLGWFFSKALTTLAKTE